MFSFSFEKSDKNRLLLASLLVKDVCNTQTAKAVCDRHGVKNDAIDNTPEDANDVLVVHFFDSAEQAVAFLDDPELGDVRQSSGVDGEPNIQTFHEV